MTFRRVDEIQEGLVAYLKSKIAITSLLYDDDPAQIKEYNWQGTEADYPGVRVRMINDVPLLQCGASTFIASIMVFDENASSADANYIAGIIAGVLRDKGFKSSGIAFYTRLGDLVPAIRQDARTWRSEVLINGTAS